MYIPKHSFAAGEISPAMYGRVDVSMYDAACKRARNVFVRSQGGISNRAGTAFVAEVKDSTKATRVIPFHFSDGQQIAIELGHQYMRFHYDGGVIVEGDKTVTGATQANPVVVTCNAHGYANGDEIFLTGVGGMTEINGRQLVVAGATANTFQLEDKAGSNVDGTAYGAFTSGGQANRVFELFSPYTFVHIFDVRFSQSADVMYMVHPLYEIRKLSRFSDTNWTLTTVTFTPGQAAPTGVGAGASGLAAWASGQSVTAGQVRSNAGKLYQAQTSGTTGATAPTHTNGTASDGAVDWLYLRNLTTYSYKVTAISDATGEESLPSGAGSASNDLDTDGTKNTVTWVAAAGAARYIVYRLDNGVYGRVGGSETTSFIDDNIIPDLADTPPKGTNPFTGAGNYPSVVEQFEQRLAFASTTNKPKTIWLSTSANFENFSTRSPAQDDDAVTFTLASAEVNAVRHLVPLTDLIALTATVEWRIKGGGDVDFVTPTSILVRPQSRYGASTVPPLVIGNVIVFPQSKGPVVRTLAYEFARDGYGGRDVAILAEHLLEGYSIVEWDYAQAPFGVVWAVRSDGKLLSLTLQEEHQVIGWALSETDGEFESVCTLTEGDEHIPYFVVKRTVDGRTVRYIERQRPRLFADVKDAYFVDCGLSYSGTAIQTVSNLHHLEGKTLAALADGNVVRGLVVTAGEVTLPRAASKIQIGLPYEALVETLPPEIETREGSSNGRLQRVSRVLIRVRDSRGMFFGPDEDRLIEWKQRSTEDWGEPIQPFTGVIVQDILPKWSREGALVFKQVDPLPMTVLSISPRYHVGG